MEFFPKRPMGGVGEIGVSVLFAAKGDEKAVRKPLGQPLWAYVCAPLEPDDSRNLIGQGTEGLLDGLDVTRVGISPEREKNEVPERVFVHDHLQMRLIWDRNSWSSSQRFRDLRIRCAG